LTGSRGPKEKEKVGGKFFNGRWRRKIGIKKVGKKKKASKKKEGGPVDYQGKPQRK